MRHPVSTLATSGGGKSRGPMARDIVELVILPAPPDDAQPGSGQDPDGVGMIAAARAGTGIDGSRPGEAWRELSASVVTAWRRPL